RAGPRRARAGGDPARGRLDHARGVAGAVGARRGPGPALRGVADRRPGPARGGARGRGRIVSERTVTEEPTAEEAAAERRRQRRNRQTVFNLVIAMVASLGVMLFLVLVVVRPEPAPRAPIDY